MLEMEGGARGLNRGNFGRREFGREENGRRVRVRKGGRDLVEIGRGSWSGEGWKLRVTGEKGLEQRVGENGNTGIKGRGHLTVGSEDSLHVGIRCSAGLLYKSQVMP